MRIVKWTALLAIFWLLLSGIYTPLLLSLGGVSVVLVMYILKRMDAVDKEQQSVGLGFNIIRYCPWLLGQIFRSGLRVTLLIWGAKGKASPALEKIDVTSIPQGRRALYANSITLTPGTLCVDLDDKTVTVHALQKTSIAELEQGHIANKVKKIWGDNK